MKRIGYILLFLSLSAYAPKNDFTINVLDKFIWGIAEVESNFDIAAYNHREKAVGLLQVRPICVADANRISGRNYTHAEMYNPFKAITVYYIITNHYGGTDKDRIERWNGGNIRNAKTERYFRNVSDKATKVYSIQNNSCKHPERRWYIRNGKEYIFD